MNQTERISIQVCIPGILSQIHYLSPYAWPLRALRSETWALLEMDEMEPLQWLRCYSYYTYHTPLRKRFWVMNNEYTLCMHHAVNGGH